MNEDFLRRKLQLRKDAGALRELRPGIEGTDFCSNDYLGIATRGLLAPAAGRGSGSTGSRLISGNSAFAVAVEKKIAAFHHADAALLFNSGYDANIGLLSAIAHRGDTIIYDQLIHASIRDGIRLSMARAYAFQHNDVADLEKKLQAADGSGGIFVVTESVFSMDGDTAPLDEIARLCASYEARLIVDEAHATGIIGEHGEGLVQTQGLEKACFARVHTFGKAAGCHGAAILGSALLRDYLINFCRPLIYTTALPPDAVAAIDLAYSLFPDMKAERLQLREGIRIFRELNGSLRICPGHAPVQGVIIPGNERVQFAAAGLRAEGFDIRPIMSPTVPCGEERLRVVIHSFNSEEEIVSLSAVMRKLLENIA